MFNEIIFMSRHPFRLPIGSLPNRESGRLPIRKPLGEFSRAERTDRLDFSLKSRGQCREQEDLTSFLFSGRVSNVVFVSKKIRFRVD